MKQRLLAVSVSLAALAFSAASLASVPLLVSPPAKVLPGVASERGAGAGNAAAISSKVPSCLYASKSYPAGYLLKAPGTPGLYCEHPDSNSDEVAFWRRKRPSPVLTQAHFLRVIHAIHIDPATIRWGNPHAPGHFYVFVGMDSPGTLGTYKQMQSMVASGKFRFTLIPVSVSSPAEAQRTASVLESANPLQSFMANEKGFNVHLLQGSASRAPVSAKMHLQLMANDALLHTVTGEQFPNLPVIIVKDPKTGWEVIN